MMCLRIDSENWDIFTGLKHVSPGLLYLGVGGLKFCFDVIQLLYSIWLIIDHLPPHRHRYGDNLPVIRHHFPRLIWARKESNLECGKRWEPPPQQLCHDPHTRSHERWDIAKERGFFIGSLSRSQRGAHSEHLWACLCVFKTCSAVFTPSSFFCSLCVCVCVYRKKPLSIILLSSAVPLPACISLPLAYITLASWKLKSRSSKRRKRNVTIHQRATQWHERVRKAFFMH